jgi:hypothetical protein
MNWIQLGGSLVAILALAGVARMLRLGESRITDADTACRMAEELLAGFEARRAIVSADGSAALVAGNGTVAVLKRHGAKVAARRLIPPLRLRPAVEGVGVDTGERMFGVIVLHDVTDSDVHGLVPALTLV